MKQILVTGGAGFVGSHLCEKLVEAGNNVTCVDNLITGQKKNLEKLVNNDSFELIEADVSVDTEEYLPSQKKFDQIYHLASPASPKDFGKYPEEIYKVNIWGTHFLAQRAVADEAKLLFTSTSEVYGEPEIHPQTEDYRGNVNIRGPRSCYDESKRMGETIQTVWAKKSGLKMATVRIFNTYGPRMRLDDGRVIPNFMRQAIKGLPLTVYGKGDQTRSFCFVDDLVDGLITVMESDKSDGEVYNLGNTEEKTVLELAGMIIELVGSESNVEHKELPKDDPSRRRPDLSKVKGELGWSPNIDLKVGLKKTADYFVDLVSK